MSPGPSEPASFPPDALRSAASAADEGLAAPGSGTPLLTSINPEAGFHPIPEDSREVDAAIRAGERCWGQFPYLQQRYGERGLRFSRSDAAWKATLYRLEPDQIIEQARWLGRVLAARGMPTVILQATLEILVEELSRAVPERAAEYAKLLAASADLLASRRRHLSDGELQALSDWFERAARPAPPSGLPQVAQLIGCAVADEREGYEGAVGSLLPWLVDPGRFSPTWIAAVESTLSAARDLVRVNAPPAQGSERS